MKYFGDYNEEHGCWNGYWVNGDEIITPKELTQRQNDFEWRPYDNIYLVINSGNYSCWTVKQGGEIDTCHFIYSTLEQLETEYIHANDVNYVDGVLEDKWKPCYKKVEEME